MPLLYTFIIIYHQDFIPFYYILLHEIICILLQLHKTVLNHVTVVHFVLVSPLEYYKCDDFLIHGFCNPVQIYRRIIHDTI